MDVIWKETDNVFGKRVKQPGKDYIYMIGWHIENEGDESYQRPILMQIDEDNDGMCKEFPNKEELIRFLNEGGYVPLFVAWDINVD